MTTPVTPGDMPLLWLFGRDVTYILLAVTLDAASRRSRGRLAAALWVSAWFALGWALYPWLSHNHEPWVLERQLSRFDLWFSAGRMNLDAVWFDVFPWLGLVVVLRLVSRVLTAGRARATS